MRQRVNEDQAERDRKRNEVKEGEGSQCVKTAS